MSPSHSRGLTLSLLVLLGLTSLVANVSHESNVGFNSTVNLSNDPSDSGFAALAATGNNVYAAWLNNTSGNSNVLFRASNNNGTSWGQVVGLSNAPTGDAVNLKIASTGNNVYAIWQANVSLINNDIFFRASNNNGSSFGSIINLSNDAADSSMPEVAVAGSFVYVTWQTATAPPDILVKVSSNNGASFGSVVNISKNAHAVTLSDMVQIAAVGTNVYVTWRDNSPGRAQTFFSRSTNNGSSFSTPISLSSTLAGETDLSQQIAAVGNNVYVAWTNDTANADNTMFAASTNSGTSFGTAINVYKGQYIDLNPMVGASGSNVYLAWTNATSSGTTDILYRSSSNNGASFGSIVDLSNTPGTSNHQVIITSNMNVFVAWTESVGSSNDETYFISSGDNGLTFGPIQNLSNNNGLSELPALAAVGGNVYAAWQDDTLGNDDILFRASNGTPFDFSISSAGSIALPTSNAITVSLVSGAAQTVTLACTNGLPSNASCRFSPSSVLAGFSATLTITEPYVTPGTYTITVTGTSGSIVHSTQFLLTVFPAGGARDAT